MSDDIEFDRSATAPPGEVVQLSRLVRRLIAGNGGPMTFTGTCSYIVGQGKVAIIDPGPEDGAHLAGLLSAVSGETVSHIVFARRAGAEGGDGGGDRRLRAAPALPRSRRGRGHPPRRGRRFRARAGPADGGG